MGKFNQITVVCVDGATDGRYAVHAIARTMAELPGAQGLLIAAARPDNLPESIRFIEIEALDYFQYSTYMVHCLHYHLHTDFALVVQEDGWALNGANWDDEWFNFDYIGAPCPVGAVNGKILDQFEWTRHQDALPVLNGGFSLRSRALLEAPAKHGICSRMSRVSLYRNEDLQLCAALRPAMERHGLRFAPLQSALRFSVEYMDPHLHQDVDLQKVFGHHGPTRRLRAYAVVETGLTQGEIDCMFGENRIVRLLEGYGYTVTRKQ